MGRNCFAAIASVAVSEMKIESTQKVVPAELGSVYSRDGIEITFGPPKGHRRG